MTDLHDTCQKIRASRVSINRALDRMEKLDRLALLAYAGLAGFGLGVAFTGLLVVLAP